MSNDFLAFAAAGGANVVTQSTYASMAALGPGFQTGIAESNQLNKVWRQASIMAAVLAQMIVDISGQNAVDDGTTATLLGNLMTTLLAASFQNDTSGAANSYSLTYTPAPVAPLTDGATYLFRPAHTNTTTSTLSVNGSPAHAILNQGQLPLSGGEIVAGGFVEVAYSAALTSFVITANTGTGIGQSNAAWGYNNAAALGATGTVNYQTAGMTATGITSYVAGVVTVTKAGTYAIRGSVTTSNATPNSGTCQLTIYHNGSPTTYRNQWFTGTGQDEGTVAVSGIVDCAANDTISIRATLSASASVAAGFGCFDANKIY